MRKCIVGVVIACGIIVGTACRNKTTGGYDIIPQDTMRVMLWEMFEADAYNETRAVTDTNYKHDTAYAALYTDIFKAHHVTRAQFSESYDYYMARPEVLRAMVDTMSERANKELMRGGPPAGRPGVTPVGHPVGPVGPNGRPIPVRPATFGGHGAPPPGVTPFGPHNGPPPGGAGGPPSGGAAGPHPGGVGGPPPGGAGGPPPGGQPPRGAGGPPPGKGAPPGQRGAPGKPGGPPPGKGTLPPKPVEPVQ